MNLDLRMTDTDNKIDALKIEAENSKKKQEEKEEWMKRMEMRMKKIEEDKKR